jgi:hypothetical protein
MNLWRQGFTGMPADYVRFHARIARVELQRLQTSYAITVHGEPALVRDGWMDGMKVLQAIVETAKGKLIKLQWHDGNQGFMKVHETCGGAGALFESDLTGDTPQPSVSF